MRLLFLSIALLVTCSLSHAQRIPLALNVVEDAVAASLRVICASAQTNNESFAISPHPDAEWIGALLMRAQAPNNCCSRIAPVGQADVVLSLSNISTTYALHSSEDSVIRRIAVVIDARSTRTGKPLSIPPYLREDVCTRDEAAAAESAQHNATHGTIPERVTSFWEDVAQPFVFIAAAATTIVLLFTVRSQ